MIALRSFVLQNILNKCGCHGWNHSTAFGNLQKIDVTVEITVGSWFLTFLYSKNLEHLTSFHFYLTMTLFFNSSFFFHSCRIMRGSYFLLFISTPKFRLCVLLQWWYRCKGASHIFQICNQQTEASYPGSLASMVFWKWGNWLVCL